ncbi:UNVERIFIED_CONTAM: hypothetical protein GTU68_019108, partial [Idotea baltica]|nr:hypothetical protein [Idotea baltica]
LQVVLACLLAVAVARPDSPPRYTTQPPRYTTPRSYGNVVEILKDDRVHPEGGSYSFDVETADGIQRSESGSPLSIDGYPTGQQGYVSFTFPNGEKYDMKFVANENGFQPESSWLPVAPEFPHPIPQFVLDQIAFAATQRSSEEYQPRYA